MNHPTDMPASQASTIDRRRLWIEAAVIVIVAVVPDIVNAAALLAYPQRATQPFWLDGLMLAQRSLTVCAVAFFIMWRSGEPRRAFGFARWEWRIDVPLAAVLVIAGWMLSIAVYSAAQSVFGAAPWRPEQVARPRTVADFSVLALMITANSIAEEVVIWGLLFTRLSALIGGGARVVFICAAVFASYHIYQGPAGALAVMSIGLLHGAIFWQSRRLWPLVVAHTALNFVAYLW
ncbi:MAG: CPBP family intramembrane metalloprotease [Phycisphaeraceae bacterium]|nr:CPBP family intramembrane metalloprotease [Phycisphaeraceae bacterium]MBX3407833.1 CPBP family intramembrane metalloprotease [Phycisphaeraceae bacterium]